MARLQVSVVVPVLNEREHIGALIEALLAQTAPPAEIVVADGGSIDGTAELLAGWAAREPRLRVVAGPGGIAENRNAAIAAASHEVIACTDAGCLPEPDWLEQITGPFEAGADWVAGMSRPAATTTAGAAIGYALMPVPEEVDPARFVPGGASQAFRKSVWAVVGGFPEGMAAGEDTLFGHRLKDAGYRPVFRPQAMVRWAAPQRPPEMLRKAFRWGMADGRAGTAGWAYARACAAYWAPVGLILLGLGLRNGWLAAAGVVVLAGLTARRTRFAYRRIDGAGKWLWVPVLHLLKMWTQTLGWTVGYLRHLDRATVRAQARRLVRAAGRAVRGRLIPGPHATAADRGGRNNVDVVVSDPAEADLWLRATPSTYRVRSLESFPPTGPDALVTLSLEPPGEDGALLRRLLGDPVVEVAVIARTAPPQVDRNRATEPALDPAAVAARPETWPVIAADDPATAAQLAVQAGLRMALAPRPPVAPVRRPLEGSGAVVVLGTVPMHDVGGGSRGAQMSQEMLARGYQVTHLYLYEATESTDLGLRFVHPRLDHRRFEDFDVDGFVARLATPDRLAILEIPHPGFLPVVERLRGAGFRIVYDLMDDWSDPALGGWGYARWAEEAVAAASDVLVASAPSLVQRLEEMTGRPVVEVANAVNTRIFWPGDHPRPADLPEGEGPVLEYHGSLYGDWFDWEALRAVAEAYPASRVVVIGDARNHPPVPGNVCFLGLKPQRLLPSYLASTDVGMVPFVVSATTHAVSPLKVFEYLAMGVPVAAPPLQPLVGLEGVYLDEELVRAVGAALNGPRPDPERARREHGWGERMGRLFAAAGLTLADERPEYAVRILERKAVRYRPEERVVR
jgi:glycosyltransferase involved in cell wall biosynthesis